ncbi:MAG: FAD-binding oxidoreductase [Verrucomicrobiota bacterium]
MQRRREFLKLVGKLGTVVSVSPLFITGRSWADIASTTINDVHSQLNSTEVLAIKKPSTIQQLSRILSETTASGEQVSLCGSRHSMGGQQFGSRTVLIDVCSLNRVIGLDREQKVVHVEAGITWPKLIDWLNEHAPELSIIQKQTGADEMTLAGALSSNIHGRGLISRPIIEDVESFTIVTASGEELECSRQRNAGLFGLAIGGYGLFGVITTVGLRLTDRITVERVVTTRPVADLVPAIEARIADGYLFGDLQYMTDESAEGFMRMGVFSCYKPAAADAFPSTQRQMLNLEQWQKLYLLAHVDKGEAFKNYRDYYLQTDGQIYWSDQHQLSTYLENQNVLLNEAMGHPFRSSLMISELYVPRSELGSFMENARAAALEQDMDIIYGTIRIIEKDTESFLAWAKEDYACIIFNLHVIHTEEGLAKAKDDFRRLIDEALALGGSYYLTYHRWARKDQVLAAYPQFPEFLRLKKEYDPEERFTSDWYRHYQVMFQST